MPTKSNPRPATVITTDAEIDAALARGRLVPSHRVVEATYDARTDEIRLRFDVGTRLDIPRKLLQGLGDAKPAQLRSIEIQGPGTGLYWPQLDVGHDVRGLIEGVFGTRKYMQRLGGAARTPAKVAASRANGKKGGRPKDSAKARLLKA